jgi:cytochrome c oxidase assembly protein Cox11
MYHNTKKNKMQAETTGCVNPKQKCRIFTKVEMSCFKELRQQPLFFLGQRLP